MAEAKKKPKRRKKLLTKAERIKWLEDNPKGRGRHPEVYTGLLQPLTEESAQLLGMACISIFINAPKGQEHLTPNKRTIDLLLPWNFRKLYGREWPMGCWVSDSNDGWFTIFRFRACRIYDYLHKKNYLDTPRSAVIVASRVAQNELIRLEKDLEHIIPIDCANKVFHEIDQINKRKVE